MSAPPFLPRDHADRVRRRVRELLDQHPLSALRLIGRTDVIELVRINPYRPVRMFAKLEGQNPSGSIKDRIALYLIADALERGVGPDATLVEASSGNTGISLAMLCARLGRRLIVTVADNVSVERYRIMKAHGAEIVFTPGELGTCGAIEKARELGERPGHHWLAQHFNEVNSFAHYETTGAEIVEQVQALELGGLDAVVATSGTTGTLMGISARVKETFPDAQVVSVWPADKIMGIRRPEGTARPEIYDERRIDSVIEVRRAEALERVNQLATVEGLLVGLSGGAALVGALSVAQRLHAEGRARNVMLLLPDWGERYLSLAEFSFGVPPS